MTYVDDWKKTIDRVRFNPHAIQRTALNALEEVNKGAFELSDPSNPFIFLLEASAINASASMEHSEALNRKMYPTMALTEDEVYLHMSDDDFIGRFSTPSRVRFQLMFDRDEIYQRAVSTGQGNIRKITIPRNTTISFGSIDFTMQYPIDIKIMAHGSLQITYNNDQISPLETLSSNLVDWRIVKYGGKERVILTVPFQQFHIDRQIMKLTLATAASGTFTFDNQFYYARVYRMLPTGKWQEIYTTHTDQVFNPTKLTAALKVNQNKLNVEIPQVYITSGLIQEEIRVDIYTTHGDLNINLEGYSSDNFTIKWQDLNQDASDTPFIAPLSVFNEFWTYSTDVTSGGGNALPFDTLRNRVIDNATGNPNVPITNAQITTRLQDLGYSVVTYVDNITNREFLATRPLPKPDNASVISGAGCAIKTLSTTMQELIGHRTVADNGNRITILPDTLYEDKNGIISVVSDVAVDGLLALSADIRARKANETRYMYSPFHYVLDMNNDRFDHRAYFLDNPRFESTAFIDENDSTGFSVGTDRVEIERIPQGYRVLIRTRSGDSWKQLPDNHVHCQLAFKPIGEKDLAYLNGTFLGLTPTRERIYEFILGTNYDLDKSDNLYLTTFQMYTDPTRPHALKLSNQFEVFYGVSNTTITGYVQSALDNLIGKANLPTSIIAISQDRVSLTLGQALSGLWTASRTVASSQDYLKHLVDVPAVYEETIFARDPVTGVIEITLDANNNLVYTILHAKGDPVLDQNNQPTYKYRQGDVVLDVDGNPVIVSSRKLLRLVDIMFVDGAYWFATEASSAIYQAEIPKTVVSWLGNDIVPVSKFLLEQTNLFFYPKSTLGHVDVIVRENEHITIQAEQSFSVTFYLSAPAFRDTALRRALSKMAIETINEALQSNVVTSNEITRRLTVGAGSDAIAVAVTGLGGSTPLDSVTLLDDSARLSIKKINRALEDNTIGVFDDVSVSFIQHTA